MIAFNFSMQHLLEDPLGLVVGVLDDALGEPATRTDVSKATLEVQESNVQSDLLLRALNRVGTVADVAADSEGEVATDSA